MDIKPGQYLRRLREYPLDAVARIAGTIGPRPPTSLAEAQAAAYLDGRLRRAGMSVSADPFRAPASIGFDTILLATLALIAVILYYWFPWPSLFLTAWCLLIAIVTSTTRYRPLLAPRRMSQNVIATRATPNPPRRRVILLAPLDSPPRKQGATHILNNDLHTTIGRLVACGLLVFFALLGSIDVQRIWWYAQVLPTAYLHILALRDIQMMLSPTTQGAVNHAGALAILLASAEELGTLQHTELWAVPLGATQTGAGLTDFLTRYPFDRDHTLFIGIESIGAGSLCYVTREGFLRSRPADPLLLQAVTKADLHDPFINTLPHRSLHEHSLVRPLQHQGWRTLTLTCFGADGNHPYQGNQQDTPDIVDPDILDRALRLVVGLIRQLDTFESA